MNGSSFQPMLDSAERAAASGDYESAESLLREAARLQTTSLGPQHPDLASTFNNLGVVCEKTNKLTDARQFYQQALSIASASLDPEHPLVITSRDNLNEFCRAHGIVDSPPSQKADVATGVQASHSTAAEPAHDANVVEAAPVAAGQRSIIVKVVAAAVVLGALALWFTRSTSAPASPQQGSSGSGQQNVSAPVTAALPARDSSQPTVTHEAAEPKVRSTANAPAKTTVPTPTGESARVIEASLCQTLSTTGARWQCTPPSDPSAGASLYFYTRIASPRGVRVHHRWYRNGTLRQDVDLTVQANPSAGYRTYSRRTVDAGEWRVEVVAADGAVLREERITIR